MRDYAHQPKRPPGDLVWLNVARIRVVKANENGGGQIQITAIGSAPVTCEVRVDGMLEDRLTVGPGDPAADIEWDGTEKTLLVLTAGDGHRLELPLTA